MSDIDELYIKAKEKLEAESFQHGTPEDVIRSICLEWLEWARTNNTKAVELLADAAKDTEGAYKAMENFARNKKGREGNCVKLNPLEAFPSPSGVFRFQTRGSRKTNLRKFPSPYGTYNKLPQAFKSCMSSSMLENLRLMFRWLFTSSIA